MTRGIKIEGRVPELNRMTIRLTVSREDAGYTQPELAKVIDAARGTVSNYERGTVTPKRQTLMAWALATGVDFHWLETGEAPSPDGDGASGSVLPQLDSNQQPFDYTDAEVSGGAEVVELHPIELDPAA